ncbi:UDP-N-acetylenolpyruvoylglucosamine reductase [Borrelia miyamotoi]|uniref:UDP-N-acetylenolpyruvoylglucosamine reductase n=1 Tax=Borrelia miyamotoi TaxID=47466 RepID=A0AAP9CFK2_9SPIR|nr:UDP-N-acetylmuramate dehydrogenase [Borrelia miyamotoi]ATQ14648.2 UDP-N-acetylmuramate dehydrogenase [Borrelia miyamotoi]ATQ15832.2 UDP-N-acetylmuramate dehydrogenase [Borrelia miyamotoi]ATQ16977.2 UDP-N-acetylmuramate dehydrogenase [Borrelia miyamotoi]ATQ18519.2 UDP-N-acetylmuramate dehydrogenase [Borrelia miyamotoi]ATQ19472.2 UDP-N-acetylmuramate dehydrogenase [Borrelia miyamotoi]
MFKNINNFLKKINIKPKTENLTNYTTYKIGGISKLFLAPKTIKDTENIFQAAIEEKVKIFVLGGGSNLLINDEVEIDFPIIYTGNLSKVELKNNQITAECGTNFEALCHIALKNELSGLEFIYGLPGTLGGAIWMNARCFGSEISAILDQIVFIDENGKTTCKKFERNEFSYKFSPFQNKNIIILKATLNLRKGNKKHIEEIMKQNKQKRIDKGHYLFPSSGSTFKNNQNFLKPTGEIIEECNLKGLKIGGASVSKYHGNFIINNNKASSKDIKTLIERVKTEVKIKTGFSIEEEVLYIGFSNKN